MQIIQQSCEFFGETPYLYGDAIERIEVAGRTCYKSDHLISDGSAEKFVTKMTNHGHWSVIEHSNFVLRTTEPPKAPNELKEQIVGKLDSDYINVIIENGHVYIGGSYRAFMERFDIPTIKELLSSYENYTPYGDMIQLLDPEEVPIPLKRITARFITDRAVLAEFTRHRPDIVFSVESQRYCAYRDDLILIIPHHYLDRFDQFIDDSLPADSNEQVWLEHMRDVEEIYKFLISTKTHDDNYQAKEKEIVTLVPEDSLFRKEKAEEGRSVLPNSTAVEMVVTAAMTEWKYLVNLRLQPDVYKQFRILIDPFKQELVNRGWM